MFDIKPFVACKRKRYESGLINNRPSILTGKLLYSVSSIVDIIEDYENKNSEPYLAKNAYSTLGPKLDRHSLLLLSKTTANPERHINYSYFSEQHPLVQSAKVGIAGSWIAEL